MKTVIISLGGSIIAPDKPDYFFLREFKNLIISFLDNTRFIIICGGGKTNSYYNEAALRVSDVDKIDLDWIGIMATRLNAELVRSIFGKLANQKVVYSPSQRIKEDFKIMVASGYKPGNSTDYCAVLLAKRFKVGEILNLSNISHVHSKDPNKHKDAVKQYDLTWAQYQKQIPKKWTPRLSSPFDPVASQAAKALRLKVLMMKGNNIANLRQYLYSGKFDGTLIHP